jgi:N-formylmaleamate deformylase
MKHKKQIMTTKVRGAVLMTAMMFAMLLGQSVIAQKMIPSTSFGVVKTGKGRPMILIPGLFCSGKVWDETVNHFKDHFTCYEITLPGFAGQPAIQSDSILKTVSAQIVHFIKEKKLKNPILVGHSLGAFVALQIGVTNPELAGDIIVVSGAPFLPALSMSADVSLDSTRKTGLLIKNSMKNLTPSQIGQYQKFVLPTMIRDSSKIALVTDMAIQSDPVTQGEVMYELFSTDLRPEMKYIHCPVLVIGDWFSYRKFGASRESVTQNYADQFSLAANLTTIAINDSSNHFIMYDEPKWFYHQIDYFLVASKTH